MLLRRSPRRDLKPVRKPETTGLLLLGSGWLFVLPVQAHDPVIPTREFRMQARMDEARVVRPDEMSPPTHGSGSEATAEVSLSVNSFTGEFSLDLFVHGIDATLLDDSHGANETAIHVRKGDPTTKGLILIDAHHFARELDVAGNGVLTTEDGFRMHANGSFNERQGRLDVGLPPGEIIDLLRGEDVYVAIHTTGSELFRSGEIRGNLRLVPEILRLRAQLDGSQVVRPDEHRPPTMGSGSLARGDAELLFYSRSGFYSFDLDVAGIDATSLAPLTGANGSAVLLYHGLANERGTPLLDVQEHARPRAPRDDGVFPHDDGFSMSSEGIFPALPEAIETGATSFDVIETLLDGETYVSVRTSSEPLFELDEIRGALVREPNEIRLVALLDGEQIVRPRAFRPPTLGSGSEALGMAELMIDLDSGDFRVELDVEGIDPVALHGAHGGNETAVQINWSAPNTNGPILIDAHHHAREALPDSNGVTPTASGFRMLSTGRVLQTQGEHFVRFPWSSVAKFIESGEVYIVVSTSTNELFEHGEIRGNLRLVPDELSLRAPIDGEQVVRPLEFRPPLAGTGSDATAEARVRVDTRARRARIDIDVDGIDPTDLDGIGIHAGELDQRGPLILDLTDLVGDGIEAAPGGFRVSGSTDVTEQTVRMLQEERAHVLIRTTTSELFRTGEIGGDLELEPEILELDAFLDGSQVVRPLDFQPPRFGSGSDAFGVASLRVDTRTGIFTFDMEVEGVDPSDIYNAGGGNRTGVHVEKGSPGAAGSILLDVQAWGRAEHPATHGVEPWENGFRIAVEGRVTQVQFAHDAEHSPRQIISALRDGNAYVAVHTQDNILFRAGELRGALRRSFDSQAAHQFVRGDCDGDGRFGAAVTDAVFLLNYTFNGGPGPVCLAACDANGDGLAASGVTDAVYMLAYGFLGGPAPPAPHPDCGPAASPRDRRTGCVRPPPTCE